MTSLLLDSEIYVAYDQFGLAVSELPTGISMIFDGEASFFALCG